MTLFPLEDDAAAGIQLEITDYDDDWLDSDEYWDDFYEDDDPFFDDED